MFVPITRLCPLPSLLCCATVHLRAMIDIDTYVMHVLTNSCVLTDGPIPARGR